MPENLKRKGISLCVPADEKKIANFPAVFLVQPKLNGERGVTDSFQGKPILLSSYENPFEFLDQITLEIQKAWEKYKTVIPFDGEIYKHGWSRERIDSALRRTVNYNPEVEELEYHIFDLKLPVPQAQRLLLLEGIFKSLKSTKLIQVPTFQATAKNWMEYSETFLSQGYEGSVIRNPYHSSYYTGRTVHQMLKYKPTEIDEYIIIGVEEAISKDGTPKAMVGSFLVKAHDSEDTFSVGAGKLKHMQRVHYWSIKETLIGKTLITKQGKIKTSSGIPTCAVAVEIK